MNERRHVRFEPSTGVARRKIVHSCHITPSTGRVKMRDAVIQRHAAVLSFVSTIEPSHLRKRVYRKILKSYYVLQMNETEAHFEYRIPASVMRLFLHLWFRLINFPKSTYDLWRRKWSPQMYVLIHDHGRTVFPSKNARPLACIAIRRFMEDIAKVDGSSFPVNVPRASCGGDFTEDSDNVVILPPR